MDPRTTYTQETDGEVRVPTYSAAFINFTPVAAATDMCALVNPVGSGVVARVRCMDTSAEATNAETIDFLLIKRTTLNTGSTPVSVPVAQHDDRDPAPKCSFVQYTVSNPTLGNGLNVRGVKMGVGTPGNPAAVGTAEQSYDFSTRNNEAIVLLPGEALAWNNNAQAISAGFTMDGHIEWTEE